MTNSITVNGNTYNDGSVAPNNMDAGGFRSNLVPMLSDAVLDFAAKQAAAAASASAAATSAASAAGSPGTNATSTTSITIPTSVGGSQAFTMTTGKSFVNGQQLVIAQTSAPTNWIAGTLTAYNSGTGVSALTISNVNGAATGATDWTISLVGAPGVTGLLNTLEGVSIASAATVNLDTATGNVVHITGTAGITAFTLTNGRERTCIADAAFTITPGASLITPGGLTITAAVNDMFKIVASGGKRYVTDYIKANGQANISVGIGGSTATGNVTLTSTSNAAQVITPATPGLYVTLPDATTCTNKGAAMYIVSNIGEYDYGVKNSAGTQLGWIRPGQTCVVGLGDNSTAAGSWACSSLEKIGVTAQLFNASSSNTGANVQRVALDANRTCLLFGGTSLYGVVYDASLQSWGAVTLIRSGISSGAYLAILSTTNQVLVVSNDTTTGFNAVTLTTSGTGIVVNTAATTALAGNWAAFGQLIAVGTSWVVSYGRATTVTALRGLTISGTTVTIGAEAALAPASAGAANIYAVDATHVLAICGVNNLISFIPYSISGATLTVGTSATATATTGGFKTLALGSGRWLASYLNTTHFASLISVNTGTNTATASSASVGTAYTNSTNFIDWVAVSNTKVCAAYSQNSQTVYFNNIVDNAGTINVGTEISNTCIGTIGSQCIAAISATGNTALFAVTNNAGNNFSGSYALDASGASPVISAIVPLLAGVTNFPATSSVYSVKSFRTLLAGGVGYGAFVTPATGNTTGTDYYSPRYSSSSVQLVRPPAVPLNASNPIAGCSGAANESWFVGTLTTGVSLCKMEAAA